ncbi:MAG: amidohydrolase family protein, partial [Thermodesulfobacteriota bacterium]|nr:amidohydrolase family protein [Thermodesulfobacteriota bacterium]
MNNAMISYPRHVVDVHTHIFEERYRKRVIADTFSMDCADDLKLEYGSDGKLTSLIESVDRNNISKCFILPVSKHQDGVDQLNDYYYQESNRDSRIVFCGTMHPEHPNLRQAMAELKSRNARMIKLHSIYQRLDILSDVCLNLFREIAGLGLPVIFDTSRIPLKYLMPEDKPDFYTTPEKMVKLHEKIPDLKIVAAHGGGLFITEMERRPLIGSGIYIDISTSCLNCDWPANDKEKSVENFLHLINHHDEDKVFFGTDSPWRSQETEINMLAEFRRQE